MKTALLHYWLTNVRGGEQVLAALGELLPGADIFTHAYRPGPFGEASRDRLWGHRVRETFIARLPLGRRHPQAYLPLMPAASRRLDLDAYPRKNGSKKSFPSQAENWKMSCLVCLD